MVVAVALMSMICIQFYQFHRSSFLATFIISTKHDLIINVSSLSTPSPPEPLETIDFCAEKCRYVPEMCSENLYRSNLSFPAPLCLNYSLTVADDLYYSDVLKGSMGIVKERNNKTAVLIRWAAAQARERRQRSQSFDASHVFRCEEEPTNYTEPMMFSEEFEFIVKLMANLKPKTYLEWGCGASTSFYPLLASENVIAIDGYPPWCEKVEEEPRVHCMSKQEKRLQFYCPELKGADNSSNVRLQGMGKIPRSTSDKDIEHMMDIYVNSLDKTGVESLDLALVDGRFRLQCALKLLPFLNDGSVLLVHDFWVRQKPERWFMYSKVFDYYYVIGYARSIVALKKKSNINSLSNLDQSQIYENFMTRKYVSRDDLV